MVPVPLHGMQGMHGIPCWIPVLVEDIQHTLLHTTCTGICLWWMYVMTCITTSVFSSCYRWYRVCTGVVTCRVRGIYPSPSTLWRECVHTTHTCYLLVHHRYRYLYMLYAWDIMYLYRCIIYCITVFIEYTAMHVRGWWASLPMQPPMHR